ncbi:hypothetical protein [Naasia aerilata]|nr:hypothetical protein [Naasia aerilata]
MPEAHSHPVDDLPVTQPMCAKHWWATLTPGGTCPLCEAQSGRA